MPWTDSLPDSVRSDIRDAGRGHLIDGAGPLLEKADLGSGQEET